MPHLEFNSFQQKYAMKNGISISDGIFLSLSTRKTKIQMMTQDIKKYLNEEQLNFDLKLLSNL